MTRLFVSSCFRGGILKDTDETGSPHLRRPLRSHDRRSRPPGRYRSRHSDRARLDRLRRRGEVRRRQGHSRRHGSIADGEPRDRITGPRHHVGHRDRLDRHLQGRRRHPGRPHRGDRKIRQPRSDGRRDARPRDQRVDRGPRGRRAPPDRRRDRLPRPLHLAEPDSRCLSLRHHHAHRRRHRSRRPGRKPRPARPARGTFDGCTKRSKRFR